MSHFTIRCRNCGTELKESFCAFCNHCKDSLLVTHYNDKEFRKDQGAGIWKFNWLPVHGHILEQSGPVVYRSTGLSNHFSLENLYIAFNGYWPEKNASLHTCTFKEYEATVVLQNAKENDVPGLIVASAGNTARAFSHLSYLTGFPIIIVVAKMCLKDMWYLEESPKMPTIAVSDGDYADAIDMAKRVALTTGLPFEGGVKNIAKRDGLGIVLLEAVAEIGRYPNHYFQAVGSGTGAIGVWEMAERFLKDGRFGSALPKLHLAQNLPFTPMVNAWKRGSRELSPVDLNPDLIEKTITRVLTNRYPAYSVQGGVYDALRATGGNMYGIKNEEAYAAMELFEKAEGIDIAPAAGVAVAAFINAVNKGVVGKNDTILLNITGGGEKRLKRENEIYSVKPIMVAKDISDKEIDDILCDTLKKI